MQRSTSIQSSALAQKAWQAEMIRPKCDAGVGTQSSFVSTEFTLNTLAGSETLRISALGLYRCFINGKRVGQDELTPGWTAYDKRLSYQTYAVADLLVEGTNKIEIWLGDGWLRSRLMWRENPIFNTWGSQIAAIAELYESVETDKPVLSTDANWQSGFLPILKSGIYFGETFDARISPKVTDGVEPIAFDTNTLVAHETTPVRELEPLPPVKSWNDENGSTVYDFGQNAGGNVVFSVKGDAGAKVVVEHAEVLDQDGNFYNVNYRKADARLEYILCGEGVEHYQPHFTFQGYRYARVTLTGNVKIEKIVSVPLSSLTEVVAGFTCSNPLVNRLVLNTLWSQRSNFIEVPTDCPQRDERMGWTGDAQVFAGTACYFADAQGILTKWVRDVMADQREDGAVSYFSPDPTRMDSSHYAGYYGSTGWGDAIAIVPWQLYLHYGDEAILRESLPAMIKWVDFVWSISDGPIVYPPRERGERGFTFGDWLQPSGPSDKPLPTIGDDAAATIYLYIAASLVARIADILGDEAQAERMGKMADVVKGAFANEFISASGRLTYDDQTSYALAFLYDLIPAKHYNAAKQYFKNAIERCEGRIGTGFIGTPALLPALMKIGETALAGEMFLQEEVPGWLYQVKQGATTIWERWDAIQEDGSIYNPKMNSYNHYAYGAVCQWLFEDVAGFKPDPELPGFENIIFEPAILPELSPVKAHHDSPRGKIRAEWTYEDGKVNYEIEFPEGCSGLLRLRPEYGNATLDGEPILDGTEQPVSAGVHTITFNYAEPKRPSP